MKTVAACARGDWAEIGNSAVISECGLYRYRLERNVQLSGLVYAFFGVNPSIADASLDDATVRKWIGFTKVLGGSRFIVGNVFAFRATNVNMLKGERDPVGNDNFGFIKIIAAAADVLVPCWGNRGKVPKALHHHIDKTMDLLCSLGKPVKTFGLTQSGDPLHPLMLPYKTRLIDWK